MEIKEIISFLIQHGYSVLFFWVLFEQLGLPIPAIPLLLAAGALAGMGRLNSLALFAVAVAAALISDLVWYQIGRKQGGKVLPFLCRLSLSPDSCVHQTREFFRRYGPRSLLVAKFLPGLNAIASPFSGIFKMPFRRFLFFDFFGIVFWAGSFIGLGHIFHQQIELLGIWLSRLGNWIATVVLGGLGLYIAWKYIQRRRFLHQIKIHRIAPEEVKKKMDTGEDLLVLDLRSTLDFEAEPVVIPGALRMPLEKFHQNHHKIPRNRDVILYCT
jgi:membrane protein DedA with SNARE-associated domain